MTHTGAHKEPPLQTHGFDCGGSNHMRLLILAEYVALATTSRFVSPTNVLPREQALTTHLDIWSIFFNRNGEKHFFVKVKDLNKTNNSIPFLQLDMN